MKPDASKERLISLARDGMLSHAYIIESRQKESLVGLAREIAREITPYGEDIHTIRAEGSSIKDKAVEELIERLYLKPLVGERTVAVIEDSDTMTLRAQNRLLKTLEEPPGGAVLLLLSSNAEHLLPTIRSRCVLYRLEEEEAKEISLCREAMKQAHALGTLVLEGKNYYSIVGGLGEITAEREQAYAFLDALEKWYRDLLLFCSGNPFGWTDQNMRHLSRLLTLEKAYESIALIEEARQDLDRRINTGYAIKNMILRMI